VTAYDDSAKWSPQIRPEDGAPGELERRIGPLRLIYQVGYDLLGFHRKPENTADNDEFRLCITYPSFWVPRWPDKDGKYGWGTSPQYAIRNDYGRYSLEDILVYIRDHAWDGKP
jgi:hypothetical protein